MANIDGDNGNNWLWGTHFADFMRGFAGDDRIYAMNGNDTAYGGVGSEIRKQMRWGESGEEQLIVNDRRSMINSSPHPESVCLPKKRL